MNKLYDELKSFIMNCKPGYTYHSISKIIKASNEKLKSDQLFELLKLLIEKGKPGYTHRSILSIIEASNEKLKSDQSFELLKLLIKKGKPGYTHRSILSIIEASDEEFKYDQLFNLLIEEDKSEDISNSISNITKASNKKRKSDQLFELFKLLIEKDEFRNIAQITESMSDTILAFIKTYENLPYNTLHKLSILLIEKSASEDIVHIIESIMHFVGFSDKNITYDQVSDLVNLLREKFPSEYVENIGCLINCFTHQSLIMNDEQKNSLFNLLNIGSMEVNISPPSPPSAQLRDNIVSEESKEVNISPPSPPSAQLRDNIVSDLWWIGLDEPALPPQSVPSAPSARSIQSYYVDELPPPYGSIFSMNA